MLSLFVSGEQIHCIGLNFTARIAIKREQNTGGDLKLFIISVVCLLDSNVLSTEMTRIGFRFKKYLIFSGAFIKMILKR